VKNVNVTDSEEDGTLHFMVNVIEPQFNLHSEEANVSCKGSFSIETSALKRCSPLRLLIQIVTVIGLCSTYAS
jgi:hypothetical protein